MVSKELSAPDRLNAEAFRACAELISDKTEFDMICRLLTSEDKITWDRVLDTAIETGLEWNRVYKMEEGLKAVGLPDETESIEVNNMSLKQVEEALRRDIDGRGAFTNEFVLFSYAVGSKLGSGLERSSTSELVAQINPVRQRLRSVAPGLFGALEGYGAHHDSMPVFYDGLIQDDPESRQYLALFTMADQLLQRLVRPGDMQYMVECVPRCMNARPNKYDPPVYDELDLQGKELVRDARKFLRA